MYYTITMKPDALGMHGAQNDAWLLVYIRCSDCRLIDSDHCDLPSDGVVGLVVHCVTITVGRKCMRHVSVLIDRQIMCASGIYAPLSIVSSFLVFACE